MATISKGILGGFSGKVGTVVGASWRGKDIIRSRPKATQRIPTDRQLLQQMKFSMVSRFLQPLKGIQNRFFGIKSGDRSRVNMAASYTMREAVEVIDNIPELAFSKVLITKGDLTGFQNISATALRNSQLKIQWEDNSAQGSASATDLVSVVCFSNDLNMFEIYEDLVPRSGVTTEVTLPSYLAGEEVQVWAYLHNKKQTAASNSFYLGAHTVL